jgi:hypothetical protein
MDSCRCWRCALCPCKVRNKFLVNFWNRTILLCISCIQCLAYRCPDSVVSRLLNYGWDNPGDGVRFPRRTTDLSLLRSVHTDLRDISRVVNLTTHLHLRQARSNVSTLAYAATMLRSTKHRDNPAFLAHRSTNRVCILEVIFTRSVAIYEIRQKGRRYWKNTWLICELSLYVL